jgi:membrane fusion protein (multidrug efflux system)
MSAENATIHTFPAKAHETGADSGSVEHAATPREINEPHGEAPVVPPQAEAPVAQPKAAAPAAAAPKAKGGGRRRIVISVVALIAIAAGAWYGYGYFTTGRFIVSTDDAYIGGDIAAIAPKVSGYVTKVNVLANQHVKAGDTLVTLDNGDYINARDQAQATLDTAAITLKRMDAQITGGTAGVAQAEAQKTASLAAQHNAQLVQQRASSLTAKAVGSQSDLDAANAALDQANAAVTTADAAIAAANANVAVLQGQRAEAASTIKSDQLTLDKANRDLSFTVLRAPYDGIVGNLAVQKGDYVSPGVRLAAIVPSEALYIDANFKETQLAQLVPGEKVTIHVDADDGAPIIGTIQSLAPASGSVFSLLPAQNATGNFTKVVQRVPVRITLPKDALDSGRLRAGLSVVVEADTRTAPARNN